MDLLVYSVLLFYGAIFESTSGYPNGNIIDACNTMIPRHGNAVPKTSQAPYNISISRSSYSAGDEVTVTLRGTSAFKGFLLQARTFGQDTIAGTFKITNADSQGLQCSSTMTSAVSHTSSRSKTTVSAVWVAPAGLGPVKFRATFLANYDEFWIVESQIMQVIPISNDLCGTQKFCFSSPAKCNPANNTGCFFMSSTPAVGGFIFEMSGVSPGYVAIGFSDDQKMGNDDIYICGRNDTTKQLAIQHAFSSGYSLPTVTPLANAESSVMNYTNGVLSCSFFSKSEISLQARDASNQYYIFLAHGPIENGQIKQHSQLPFISDQKTAMTSLNSVSVGSSSTEPSFTLLKVHGALMLIAWMTTGSIGMIIARYLKNAVKKPLLGKDFWFQAHRFLMVLTVAIMIVGFVLVFVYVRGWSDDAGAHPVLGCIVMILSFFQPIAALFRPAPKSKRRFIFNWSHALNALVIKVLAVAAIFLGLLQHSTSGSGWMIKVMGGFVAWEALAYIILEVNSRLERREYEKPDGMVKKEMIVLLIFICGNLAFLIALFVGIGQL